MGTALAFSVRAERPTAPAPNARDERILQLCGPGDAILHAAARQVANQKLEGKDTWSMLELGRYLQTRGLAHAGARAWTLKGSTVDRRVALVRLRAWLASNHPRVARRCGVASVQDSARGEVLTVVTAPRYADFRSPLPQNVRTGAWVTIDAVLYQGADRPAIVVLRPRGAPRTIPSSYDRHTRRVVGRFMADRSGTWVVQVVANTRGGPLPVLQSEVRVGSAVSLASSYVPGESAGLGLSDADALFAKLNSARRSERVGMLIRDRDLDQVAEQHVMRMMKLGRIVHDTGEGSPPERVAEAGIRSREVGENVSKASNPSLAHRALWNSPSHRTNTLHPRFERVGIAARRDEKGNVWVTQLFAGR